MAVVASLTHAIPQTPSPNRADRRTYHQTPASAIDKHISAGGNANAINAHKIKPTGGGDKWNKWRPDKRRTTTPTTTTSSTTAKPTAPPTRPNTATSWWTETASICGTTATATMLNRRRGRIIGGRAVQYGTVPWQADLRVFRPGTRRFEHLCGGAIITRHLVLTAAHCVQVSGNCDQCLDQRLSREIRCYFQVFSDIITNISSKSFDNVE